MRLPVNVPRSVLASSLANWMIWGVCLVAISSQFLGLFLTSMDTYATVVFGRSPLLPMTPIQGFNDEAYADRAVVCIREGDTYVPKQLSKVLQDPLLATPANGPFVNGFRVVQRNVMTLSPSMRDTYARICDRLAFTLTPVLDSCVALGFNVTRDGLRIVHGIEANAAMLVITRALPVLIVPFYDNGVNGYYVAPSSDGAACVFRLAGTCMSSTLNYATLRAAPRSVRTGKAEEWLQKPGGQWRNGWYEDPQGQPWMVSIVSTKSGNPLGINVRQFDTLANKELDCDDPPTASQCKPPSLITTWGKRFSTTSTILQSNQVFISNGKRFGLFLSDNYVQYTTTISYPLETFVSNISVFILLFRWFVSMASMQNSYRKGVSTWQTTGVGCLSSSRTFNLLPIMLLPQLKMTLTVFSTIGCFFEGQQIALASAWYTMYPGIVELMFYYYGLLNVIGKITYRRISDALFGPTLLALCALHFFRLEIAQIKWLGLNGRISTVLLSAQVDTLKLTDFFTTDVALQLNGNVEWLFFTKLGVLALSLLPLVFSEKMGDNGVKAQTFAMCAIEKALAVRASHLGGLGRSPVYVTKERWRRSIRLLSAILVPRTPSTTATPWVSTVFHGRVNRGAVEPLTGPLISGPVQQVGPAQMLHANHVLLSYELSRIGYLVFGGRFLISFEDWYVLASIAPLRTIERLWNYRVVAFVVTKSDDGLYGETSPHPQLLRLDDPQLRAIPVYDVTVCAFR